MITYCPECKAKYDLPDSRKGIKFRCKICGGTVYTDDLRRLECIDPFGIEDAPSSASKPAPKPAPNLPGFKPAAQAFDTHSKLDDMENDLFDFSDTRSMPADIARQAVEEADAAARPAAVKKPVVPVAPVAPIAPVVPAAANASSTSKSATAAPGKAAAPASKPAPVTSVKSAAEAKAESTAVTPPVVPAAPVTPVTPVTPVEPVEPVEPVAPALPAKEEKKAEKTAIFKNEPEEEEALFDFGDEVPQAVVSQQQVSSMPEEEFGEDDLMDFGGEESPAASAATINPVETPEELAEETLTLDEEPATTNELLIEEEPETPTMEKPESPVAPAAPAVEEFAVLEEEEPAALEELSDELLPMEELIADEPSSEAESSPEELPATAEEIAIAAAEPAESMEESEDLLVEEETTDELAAVDEVLPEELPATAEEIAIAAEGPADLTEESEDLLLEEPVAEVAAPMEEIQEEELTEEPILEETLEVEEALEPVARDESAEEPMEPGAEAEAVADKDAQDEDFGFDEAIAGETPAADRGAVESFPEETQDLPEAEEPAAAASSEFAAAVSRWRKVIHDDNDLEFLDEEPAGLPEAPVVDLHALFPPRLREVKAVCSACNARYHLPEHYSNRRKLRCAVCSQPVMVLPAGEDFPPLPAVPEALESPAPFEDDANLLGQMPAEPEVVDTASEELEEAEAVAAVAEFEAEVVEEAGVVEEIVDTLAEETRDTCEQAEKVELDLGELDEEAGELDLDAALEQAPEQPAAPAIEPEEQRSSHRPRRMEMKPRPEAGKEEDALFDFGDATGLANVVTGSDSSVYSPITNDTAAEMRKKKKADGEKDEDLIDWE